MFGKIRRNDFLQAHGKLREFFILKLRHDLCEEAKKHLQRGLMIRLGMMEEAILSLDSEVGKTNEPLNHYLVIKLTLFLNAYYLNLAGSLDNLAWALAYQHKLMDEIDEDNLKHRRLAQLVSKDFLRLLRQNNLESLCTMLEPVQAWYWDIREFRDPAAHRIPLNVPSAICSEDDIQRAKELDEQAAALISGGEWESGVDLMHQSYRVGQHVPVFIAEAPKIQVYDLAGRIDHDHGIWLEVVNNVLQEGFGSGVSPTT
jgi:hypothetical protein